MDQIPIWQPSRAAIFATNIRALMREIGVETYEEAHRWSVTRPEAYWGRALEVLGIRLRKPFSRVLDISEGVTRPKWLPGAEMNIAESCFGGDRKRPAIITRRLDGRIEVFTVGQLDCLSNRVANGLKAMGLGKGDAVAINMPMTVEAAASYFGIIKMGGIVVSIPDSFPADQIAKRLGIGDAKAVITQDVLPRGEKFLPMYEKNCEAAAPVTVVIPAKGKIQVQLRDGDLPWNEFLGDDDRFQAVACKPQDATNYIFSSGTTGDPKCIPWDHTTGIKSASDAMFHQDVKAGDVLCWPTNLGWMMGPWTLYAALLNKGTVALYEGAPIERAFCEFVQDAKVTILGLVPSIAVSWRNTGAAARFDWSRLRCFSSSGEASNPEVYGWLMGLNQPAGTLKPVIEYCGGTETGGAYAAGRMDGDLPPSVFSGKVMGMDFVVLDENGAPCPVGQAGEIFLKPPAIGLSTRLHKGDNDKVYYDGCPPGLRRHGDRIVCLEGGRFKSDGRADNAMNLNGIKIGSTEIEAVTNTASPDILETAAVGVPTPGGGPDRLVVYTVMKDGAKAADLDALKAAMQQALKHHLNPQFHVHDIRLIDALPRTASFKVMHRTLRDLYAKEGVAA